MPTELFAQETKVPCTLQGIAKTSLERLSRSTNKRNPMYLSCRKPIHTTGGSRRGAQREAGARSGTIVRQQNCARRKRLFFAISKASKTRRLNLPSVIVHTYRRLRIRLSPRMQRLPYGLLIPGHTLHEKGSQRRKRVGPLVSSQERRALSSR